MSNKYFSFHSPKSNSDDELEPKDDFPNLPKDYNFNPAVRNEWKMGLNKNSNFCPTESKEDLSVHSSEHHPKSENDSSTYSCRYLPKSRGDSVFKFKSCASHGTLQSHSLSKNSLSGERMTIPNSNAYIYPYTQHEKCARKSSSVSSEDEFLSIESSSKSACFETDSRFALKSFDLCTKNLMPDNTRSDLLKSKTLDHSKLENLERNTSQFSTPLDVVMHYRQVIDKKSEEHITKLYFEIDSKRKMQNNEKYFEVSKKRGHNLTLQLELFEKVVSNLKSQLSSACAMTMDDAIQCCEEIKNEFQFECKLLAYFFPAYAFREDFLNSLKKNQVLIINADNSYCFNMLLPLLIRIKFPSFIVSCETCEFLKLRLCKWLCNFLEKKVETEWKLSDNRMLCATEGQMLNYFAVRKFTFEQTVYVILNLPLVRSVESDLLLANFQDMLRYNKASKLILLTSPYADTDSYQKYFSKLKPAGISVLKTDDISFPVTTIWKNYSLTPLDDYISQIIDTIMGILVFHDYGDVLAFLPAVSDIKHVAEILRKLLIKYQYNDVEYFLVHENALYALDYEALPKSKRKIFLATSCAEVTVFPSVQFVVDCGLKKMTFYDSVKKRDIQRLVFISCQSAKSRKILAGNFNSGVCYRIYNRRNYCKDMPPKDYPEILIVNPFNTMIKILQCAADCNWNSRFIDFLPPNIYSDTIHNLQKYGAVKGNSLTPLGKNMGKLPFQEKYSRFILIGLEQGFAFETVILVAFFSNHQEIFFHSDNEKIQRFIDAVKLQLTRNESDTFMYLCIYKKWMEAGFSLEWCKKHYINLEVMTKIKCSVIEMCSTISNCLGKDIHQCFSDLQDRYLTEIVFDCFYHNLCVYTGHSRSGYRVLSSSSMAFIHAASVIYQMENPPQFILYDHMISDSKNVLLHITAVPDELIMKALTNEMVPFDYEDLFEKTLTCRIIETVGEEVMNEIFIGSDGKKKEMMEEQIRSECGNDFIFLELSIIKRRVSIYALPDYINFAQTAVEDIVRSKFGNILNEHHLEVFELKYEQNKIYCEINWSKGAVATYLQLKLHNETSSMSSKESSGASTFNFSEPSYFPYQLCIAWIRRPCSGKGYVNFSNAENFMSARKLALKYIQIFGVEIFIEVSNKRENQLCITGLPPETNIVNLKKEIQLLLPASKIENIALEYKPPFVTLDEDVNQMTYIISDVCAQYTILGEYDIIVPKPETKDLDTIVYINTYNNEALSLIAEVLSSIVVKNKKFITKILYNLVIKCNKQLCKVLKPVIISELRQVEQDVKRHNEYKTDCDIGLDIDLECEEKALIKISSSDNEILSLLHRKVNDLLQGETLRCNNIKGLENIFFHGGQAWLKNLAKTENMHIGVDNNLKTLTLYGSQEACDNVKCQIAMFLEDAGNDVMLTILLGTENSNRRLLKAVIKEYGVNLERLVETCELRSALLDIKSHQLLIRGSSTSVEKVEQQIKALSDGLDINLPEAGQSSEVCPVCLSPAYNLTFRLEHCGHLYCPECIQALVEEAKFPIICCAENCSKDIVLKDIRKVLKNDSAKIKVLLRKSLKDYQERNQTNLFFCPAPDCEMFLHKNEISEGRLTCILCKNDVCTKCNVLYHGGYTCDMYQNSKKDPDYSFKVWQKMSSQCKQCPRCKTAIEKISGCNRMKCSSCKGNFCWICVQEFPTENQVYDHIHSSHQGMLFA